MRRATAILVMAVAATRAIAQSPADSPLTNLHDHFAEAPRRARAERTVTGRIGIVTGAIGIVCGVLALPSSHPPQDCGTWGCFDFSAIGIMFGKVFLSGGAFFVGCGACAVLRPTLAERYYPDFRDLPGTTAGEETDKLRLGERLFEAAAHGATAARIARAAIGAALGLAGILTGGPVAVTLGVLAAGTGVLGLLRPSPAETQWKRYQYELEAAEHP